MVGRGQPGRFPQSTFGPVPFDRAADAARGGEADPHEERAVLSVPTLRDERAFWRDDPLGGRQKIGPVPQAFDGWRVIET
jgi:hypothetical protein